MRLPFELLRPIAFHLRDSDPPLFQLIIDSDSIYDDASTLTYRNESADLLWGQATTRQKFNSDVSLRLAGRLVFRGNLLDWLPRPQI
ncbi:hypothetical protein SISSUDRAFT_1054089 [Sistotremastrum suecicum HHB10207 ss-3]|uniref:Uncharacterized protein n=1 Tax=Sistotremastrum suecicum HHB10207 ss-3 TaxID=1314776 RepID=A0A165YRZ7_9AGAM|nr:hypothetical protein SISSUDRAFT_1054089 [Sistotremastrum suecicum HHB10207 ss-3]